MYHFKKKVTLFLIIAFNISYSANHLIDPTTFKKTVQNKPLVYQKPEFFYGLCAHGLSSGLISLSDIADHLPKDWKTWSKTEQNLAKEEIITICKQEKIIADQRPEPENANLIFAQNWNRTPEDIHNRFYDFVQQFTAEKKQEILHHGINTAVRTAPNFIDLCDLYWEAYEFLGESIISEAASGIATPLKIQDYILDILKELIVTPQKELQAIRAFGNETKPNITIIETVHQFLNLPTEITPKHHVNSFEQAWQEYKEKNYPNFDKFSTEKQDQLKRDFAAFEYKSK